MVRTPTFFCSVSILPALVTVSLECIKTHRGRCSDGFSCVLDRLSFSNKIRPGVALRGAHQKMFLHAVLAHTGNDATNFQGITDRLAALSPVDHDLPLKSSESTQNLRQLPDPCFAGRLVLLDQCSPSLEWSGQFSNAFPLQRRISA